MREGLEKALTEAMEDTVELPEEPTFRAEGINSTEKQVELQYQSLSGTPELPSSDEEDED